MINTQTKKDVSSAGSETSGMFLICFHFQKHDDHMLISLVQNLVSQKAKKQRKTHIVGTASARKRTSSKREVRSDDLHSGSETTAEMQKLLAIEVGLEPVGQEKIDTSLQKILSDLPEDEVPPGDETGKLNILC
jgi:hypothetical protein